MHRSGTSAVTRVLNLLGVPLPSNLVGSFAGNELGHWEPAELPALHDQMLREAGSNVNGVLGVDRAWFASASAAAAADAVAGYVSAAFPDAPLFALKDPRMALFIPIWRRALHQLGVAPRFVLPFRAPTEVAASLTRRQLSVFSDSAWPPARGELVWLNYVLSAERDTRDAPRTFVRFDALLDNWRGETARMGAQLGIAWPRSAEAAAAEVGAYLSREHKHENHPEPATTALGRRVLAQLDASVGEPHGDGSGFEAAAQELEAARGLFGDYVAALESLLGALPVMKTEFGDFPSPLETLELPGSHAAPDRLAAALERSRALLIGAAAERRVQAALIRELQALNSALTQSQVASAASHPSSARPEQPSSAPEGERWREEAEALRAAQGPADPEDRRVEDAADRAGGPGAGSPARKGGRERRAAELFNENEQNKVRLAHAQRDMQAVLRSTSWKLTAPVRKIRSWISPPRAGAS
jgi:hypothetical protein